MSARKIKYKEICKLSMHMVELPFYCQGEGFARFASLWIEKNLSYDWAFKQHPMPVFYFKEETDVVAFKLMWL